MSHLTIPAAASDTASSSAADSGCFAARDGLGLSSWYRQNLRTCTQSMPNQFVLDETQC
eukprot:COSAG02_NODE_29514_length_567_cov_119.326923_1_plen_58_part_10